MKKFAIAAAVLLFLAPAASAGAYVGASLGQSDTAVAGFSSGDDVSWKLVGGYTFMKFIGVEGSYRNLGGIDETIGTSSFSTDTSSLDVFGVGILPLGKVDLFAKLGYSRLEMDATVAVPQVQPLTVSLNENEMAYGAGLAIGFGKVAVRIEYEAFNTTETMDMISAGAVFKF